MNSLIKILQSLITTGNNRAIEQIDETEDSRKEITSIRLKPQTRAYLQAQSETLGISVSQLINIMVDGIVTLETAPHKNRIDSIYDRLMLLFEQHNIYPLEMSMMLKKYGVTLSKLKSRDTMLDMITPELITDVSNWFGTNPLWLNGKSEEIYRKDNMTWYKRTECMAASLISLRIKHNNLHVYAIKRSGVSFTDAEESDSNENRMDMGFLLKYKHEIAGVSFDKYEFCEFQRWNHARCRDNLKLLFKFISTLERKKNGVRFYGLSADDNIIEKIHMGKIFPSKIENKLFRHGNWDPKEHYKDILRQYRRMRFTKYIFAYCNTPHKTFIAKYNKDGMEEKWEVIIHTDKEIKHEYVLLSTALEDTYNKYHKISGEDENGKKLTT